MAHLLIWGEPRDLVVGELPAGLRVDRVSSLAALVAALDSRGGALVLADAACLEAEREGVQAWAHADGASQASLVAVTDQANEDDVVRRLPFVDDVVRRPLTPARVRLKLERAVEAVHSRRVIRQLESALTRRSDELAKLNEIGIRLSAERDIDVLLELILSKSREITGADAGSLYLVERPRDGEPRLRFNRAQNDTVYVPFQEFTMPLDQSSIAGYVAESGRVVNVADAYLLPAGTPFSISRSFDESSGYRTKSMLVVPMCDHKNVVIGVVQLINKKRDRDAVLKPLSLVEQAVVPFTPTDEELARSLASQAAVAFENADLIQRIRTLFDNFVHAAVKAVEKRDPVTSGHSERVAVLTVELARKVDATSAGPYAGLRFTPQQIEEIRYASLLHDFGKVAVQEKFLRKGKKLYATELIGIRQRFAYILKAREVAYLRARLELLAAGEGAALRLAALEADYARHVAEIETMRDNVIRANDPTVVEEQRFSALTGLQGRHFPDLRDAHGARIYSEEDNFPVEEWAQPPYLSSEELEALQIRKGSLTGDERKKIEEHVSHTYEFLCQIPWTGDLQGIPLIAWAHHEKLDGSGYPRGIRGDAIPPQSKMMAVADIFDALVAQDRPYKKAVSVETALRYMHEDAARNLIDGELLRVFVEGRLYELPEFARLLLPRG